MVSKAQIPNLLCVARIALIIPLWAVWSSKPVPSAYIFIFGVFVLAALTDWLDGVCARKWQVQSPLGAMLDQIADKLLMVSIFIILTYDHLLPATLTVLLILREVWVSGVREYVGSQNKELPVSKLGKWKTALQMIGVGGFPN